ncbi:MAG TPA: hypothetical protein VKW76_01775 [Candidatus Binatia bacterium]|nr:hypothetical protein [Candidatus Binatia bacterium]
MAERDPHPPEKQPTPTSPADAAYTEEEEAEVQKRLEELGYVE